MVQFTKSVYPFGQNATEWPAWKTALMWFALAAAMILCLMAMSWTRSAMGAERARNISAPSAISPQLLPVAGPLSLGENPTHEP